VLETYAAARRDGITAAEFERARNKLASRVVLAGERPRRRLFEVGGEWAHAGRYRSVAETLAIVESLSLDDLHRVQDRWPLDAAACTVLAGPGDVG
jgi:predicted Zn-dependent peptidase